MPVPTVTPLVPPLVPPTVPSLGLLAATKPHPPPPTHTTVPRLCQASCHISHHLLCHLCMHVPGPTLSSLDLCSPLARSIIPDGNRCGATPPRGPRRTPRESGQQTSPSKRTGSRSPGESRPRMTHCSYRVPITSLCSRGRTKTPTHTYMHLHTHTPTHTLRPCPSASASAPPCPAPRANHTYDTATS